MLGQDSSHHNTSSTSRSILSHTGSMLGAYCWNGREEELVKWKRKEPRWLAFTIKGQMGLYAQPEFAFCHMYVPAIEGQGFFPS